MRPRRVAGLHQLNKEDYGVGKGKAMKTIGLQKRLEIDYETLKRSALSLIIFPSHRHYGQKLSLIGVPYLSLGKIVDVHVKTKFICFSFQIVMPDPETMSHSHPISFMARAARAPSLKAVTRPATR